MQVTLQSVGIRLHVRPLTGKVTQNYILVLGDVISTLIKCEFIIYSI